MADADLTTESDKAVQEFLDREKEVLQEIDDEFNDEAERPTRYQSHGAENSQQQTDDVQCPDVKVTDNELTEDGAVAVSSEAATTSQGDDSTIPADEEFDEDIGTDQSLLTATGGETGPRASISLQRVASVEEIRNAMARAEQGRPRSRRRRQESETMQQWRKDFDERLRVKDELEEIAIEELKREADKAKEEWYAQWRAEVAERRELRRMEEQEAADALEESKTNSTCWQRMSHIAKSLNTRRESKDLNRMRTLLIALEKPPKRTVAT